MNTHRDPDRLIHAFLMEGATELADEVYVTVRDRIEQTRQRAVIGSWREPDMDRYLKFGLAAAAVLVVAIIGFRQFGGANVASPGSTESPAPTATPAATPSPSLASPSPSADGSVPETFIFDWPGGGGPRITATIPANGWAGDVGSGVLVGNNGGDPPNGAAIIGPFFGDLYVYGDPCRWSTTLPDTPATTVDEAVVALTAQASRDATAPADITVGGHAGKTITLHVPDDTVDAACDQGKFASWAGGGDLPSAGPSRYHQGPGQIDELWILDVDGELVVMDAMYGAETSAEHLADLHAILESMTFE